MKNGLQNLFRLPYCLRYAHLISSKKLIINYYSAAYKNHASSRSGFCSYILTVNQINTVLIGNFTPSKAVTWNTDRGFRKIHIRF